MNVAICKRRNGNYTATNLQLGKDREREKNLRGKASLKVKA